MRSKRAFDICGATLGLLLTAPLWPILALLVRITSAGPVFYRALRAGRGGEPFTMLKFRTMHESPIVPKGSSVWPKCDTGWQECDTGWPAIGITGVADPRITPIGRLLRATKLDELPQLWNVLCGQMSLVGPRPEAVQFVRLDDIHQREVLALRPGITGLAQLAFRHEHRLLTAHDVEQQYREEVLPRKLEIDLQYVAHRTLLGDIGLMFRTVSCLVSRNEVHTPLQPSLQIASQPDSPLPLQQFLDRQVLERLRLHGRTFTRDAAIIVGAYALGMGMRFDASIPSADMRAFLLAMPWIVTVYAVNSYLFGIHRRMWHFAGITDLRAILLASSVSTAVVAIGDIAIPTHRPVPLSVVIAGGVFGLALLIAVRMGRRLMWAQRQSRDMHGPPAGAALRVLIVGAGNAGQLLVRDLRATQHPVSSYREHYQIPIGFVDDDPQMQRMTIQGVPVLGMVSDLPAIAANQRADVIGIAVPSATTEQMDRFLALAQRTEARIRILPSLAEITSATPAGRTGRAPIRLRDIRLEDLLDRPHPSLRNRESVEWLEDRIVLVTGAAGSIGSELCAQLRQLGPRRVIALDTNETGLFHLESASQCHTREHAEVTSLPAGVGLTSAEVTLAPLTSELVDITDYDRMQRIFKQYRPDIIFHAAAYKHVPMLEAHPHQAVVVNVVGTRNLCRLAAATRCERFIFISTDKAVEPRNALGYSKRIGELLVQAHGDSVASETIFSSVRFGNVIGSRGSALPEFVRQVDEGGPVTVTHPEVERYFMTIPEAVSLVIQAGELGNNDTSLFMLDMGEPIRILDLVHRLIRLRGLRPGKDIEIIHTGLRPGEKLREELSFPDEQIRSTAVPGVFALETVAGPSLEELERSIALLSQIALHEEPEGVIAALARVAREMGSGSGDLESVS